MKSIVNSLFTSPTHFALVTFLILVATMVVIGTPRMSSAESPTEAISRIRSGAHAQMPPPQTAYASGAADKGMTIENGTGYLLKIHFDGPVSRTVDVPNGQSAGVELVVGRYQVAAEVPGSQVVPFYGEQSYQPKLNLVQAALLRLYNGPQRLLGMLEALRTSAAEPLSAQAVVGSFLLFLMATGLGLANYILVKLGVEVAFPPDDIIIEILGLTVDAVQLTALVFILAEVLCGMIALEFLGWTHFFDWRELLSESWRQRLSSLSVSMLGELIMSEAALGAYRTAIMIEPDINGVSGILPAHLASVLGIPTNMTLVPAMAVATLSVIVPSLFALSSYGIYPLAMFLAASALSGPIIALHLVRGLLGIMTEAIPRIAEIVDEVINLLSALWSLFRHGAQSLHEKLLEAKRKRGLRRQLQKYMEAERRLKFIETSNLLRRRWEVQRQLEHYLKGGR